MIGTVNIIMNGGNLTFILGDWLSAPRNFNASVKISIRVSGPTSLDPDTLLNGRPRVEGGH